VFTTAYTFTLIHLGEKLVEVTKRDERDKGGRWNRTCEENEEKLERKIENNLENREIFQVFRAIGFQILALMIETQRSLVVRLRTFGKVYLESEF
jgi:hypothetical protein